MKIELISELYNLISIGIENIPSRQKTIILRKNRLYFLSNSTFTKIAFDTRRIDQENEYNPRRGLQHYHRSDAFISNILIPKLENLAKLKDVLIDIKSKFGKKSEWQDSNARVLLSTLENGLRTIQKDGDMSETQPSIGSLNYIEELLHVRYRLSHDDLEKLGTKDLEKVILSKDEELTTANLVSDSLIITKGDASNYAYDVLLGKLFGTVQATKENPEVERTITITIKDKIKG